jgi:hypothetical protein
MIGTMSLETRIGLILSVVLFLYGLFSGDGLAVALALLTLNAVLLSQSVLVLCIDLFEHA